ncbi:ClpXP protease specificity-enhancing factor [Thiomicrospira microaerophila]|uniref:ClpXP protease specificity-enhancing factor n=1 Tax=Thiomicrospira microaerophila TaxID=406020 RepID=UPI00200D08F0|nr:ClpXP protease specificity-enhancing factor [Thiomicrospira microaerophila]UQB42819.1 ClpXP protease specificity-enhancing factor [Thiomicrospira microaerophila]
MISNRPYLVRAIYQWIVDNDWTPHFQVDANHPFADVPQEFVNEGVIVLNASPTAVQALDMANDQICFRARFQGVERKISFPPQAVLAVFARENGQGMPFPPEPYPTEDAAPLSDDKPKKRATLKVVK